MSHEIRPYRAVEATWDMNVNTNMSTNMKIVRGAIVATQ
jgi:hypothetical protein